MVVTARSSTARRSRRGRVHAPSAPTTIPLPHNTSPRTSQLRFSNPSDTSPDDAPPAATPHSHIPPVQELLTTPIRPSDIFQFVLSPCVHSLMLLIIKVIRAAAAESSPEDTHRALLHFHMILSVVLRIAFRGERGWRSTLGQMHALRRRISRATRGEWDAHWKEALDGHKAREECARQQFSSNSRSTTRALRVAHTLRLASQAQYARAMRTLTNDPIANLNDPQTHSVLQTLHPPPAKPISPINQSDLPPPAEHPRTNSPTGCQTHEPELCCRPRPHAGKITASNCYFTIRRLVLGDIPEQSLPLIAAATLLPLRPRPDKIRPIAIGQALRRLVTKALLPSALSDAKEYLDPAQVANRIPSAMDAIFHDARMLMRRHGSDPNYMMVSIDAKNPFNCCSRQQMLESLVHRALSLARSINAMYARTTADIIIPATNPRILKSQCNAVAETVRV